MVALPDQLTKESAIHRLRGSAMPSVSRHFTRTYVIFERNCYDLGECFVSKKVRLITTLRGCVLTRAFLYLYLEMKLTHYTAYCRVSSPTSVVRAGSLLT